MGVVKHGMYGTRIYRIWSHMLSRCRNKTQRAYKWYGARGIQVCERWMRFENFYEDMNSTYKDSLTLDRIDCNGNYEPSNCRWIPILEQSRNRRVVIIHKVNGKERTQSDIYLGMGLRHTGFKRWLALGFTVEELVQAHSDRLADNKKRLTEYYLLKWKHEKKLKQLS